MSEKLKPENRALAKDTKSHGVELDQVEKMIAIAKDEVLKEARVEIDKQLQIDKVSLITVFSIFASVLSFLTIEFSFFKKFDSLKSISGFSCILFSLLFGFNIGLDYLVKSNLRNDNNHYNRNYLILLIALFCVGICLVLRA